MIHGLEFGVLGSSNGLKGSISFGDQVVIRVQSARLRGFQDTPRVVKTSTLANTRVLGSLDS